MIKPFMERATGLVTGEESRTEQRNNRHRYEVGGEQGDDYRGGQSRK
jgi:hypothetical protein